VSRTGHVDELVVELPSKKRFGKLAEPQLEDGGDVVDVGEILLGEKVGSLDVYG
jgi:hypothetical protein